MIDSAIVAVIAYALRLGAQHPRELDLARRQIAKTERLALIKRRAERWRRGRRS